MCDRQVVWLRNCVQPLRETIPKVVLQRVEETHPTVKECLVSGLGMLCYHLVYRIYVVKMNLTFCDIHVPVVVCYFLVSVWK
jgi:hypothetical protein